MSDVSLDRIKIEKLSQTTKKANKERIVNKWES